MNRRTMTGVALVAGALVAAGCSADEGSDTDTTIQTTTEASPPPPPPAAPGTAQGGMLDPETSSRDELAAVPGMTPEIADAVIAARPYSSMTALDKALGSMSETQKDTVFAHVWKPIDLNTATDEEILLIPGIGDRMLREFKEYRPYTNIEQFRREIGKYVDETEVTRLERYVTIR
jgi:DNA uptake protein ComE-like DNA-binding protein